MTLTCLIRKELVVATPEEIVRQRLLASLIHDLGYPMSTIAVEKSLHQLTQQKELPARRADILCYTSVQGSLHPLLLIECKAVKLTEKMKRQVCGYNAYIKAYFVAIANEEEAQLGWVDPKTREYRFANGIPRYDALKAVVAPHNA